ncbi:MAG: hypothetical protein JJU07_06550 [Natronohydrobacter sp.]|nr:hypothetical protein [Natronohydrobacter sp.]
MRYCIGALVGVMGASAALADTTRFDGTYAVVPEARLACDLSRGTADIATIRIENGQYFGVVATCRLANPTTIRGMDAMLFDLQCTGEGAEWGDRILLMKKDDGSLLRVVNGMSFVHPPCAVQD